MNQTRAEIPCLELRFQRSPESSAIRDFAAAVAVAFWDRAGDDDDLVFYIVLHGLSYLTASGSRHRLLRSAAFNSGAGKGLTNCISCSTSFY
jgi:hypothetical protein